MNNYRQATSEELKKRLEERNYWLRIQEHRLLEKVQAEAPARIIQDGVSRIISCYNGHLDYLCTIHRVITKNGDVIHEDVKDVYLDGIRYKALK